MSKMHECDVMIAVMVMATIGLLLSLIAIVLAVLSLSEKAGS